MDRWSIGTLVILIAVGTGTLFMSAYKPDQPDSVPPVSGSLPDIIPGASSSLYRSDALGFTIHYPSSASVLTSGFEGYLTVTGTPLAGFALPPTLFEGTNLNEAGVYIGTSTDPDIVAVCTETSRDASETSVGDMVIDGASFKVNTSTGVGAGNIYELTAFRTVHDGACIEVVEVMHSSNIGNYPAGAVRPFDREKISSILDGIVQTFQLVK